MIYFGRGCRSVRKLFILDKYDLSILLNSINIKYYNIKYYNNYKYNKYYKYIYKINNLKFNYNSYIILK